MAAVAQVTTPQHCSLTAGMPVAQFRGQKPGMTCLCPWKNPGKHHPSCLSLLAEPAPSRLWWVVVTVMSVEKSTEGEGLVRSGLHS